MTDNRIYSWQIIPRTELEAHILGQKEIQDGLNWSKPAIGHPEKSVGFHVFQVLHNIDKLEQPISKKTLRLVAILHDTFKYQENKLNSKHCHGLLARKFMEQYTDDRFLLDLLEWHDEAYRAWVVGFFQNNFVLSEKRIQNLIQRFGSQIQAYQQFFICDSKMMDKRTQPMQWFDRKIKKADQLSLGFDSF